MFKRIADFFDSSPETEDEHSLDTVYRTVSTAQGQDLQAVIFKIPGSKSTPRDHFHFCVEILGDPTALTPLMLEVFMGDRSSGLSSE